MNAYLQRLEEDNLFEMNLLTEAEGNLETLEKESQGAIIARQMEIDEVDKNIQILINTRKRNEDKHTYYNNILDSNADKKIDAKNQGKAPGKTISTTDLKTAGNKKGKSEEVSAFNLRLVEKGANLEQIKFINEKVKELGIMIDAKADEGYDKFTVLVKVERELHLLYEARKMF